MWRRKRAGAGPCAPSLPMAMAEGRTSWSGEMDCCVGIDEWHLPVWHENGTWAGRDWDELAWWSGNEDLRLDVAAGLHIDGIGSSLPPKSHRQGRCHWSARPGTYTDVPKLGYFFLIHATTPAFTDIRWPEVCTPPYLEGTPRVRPLERMGSLNRCTGRVGHVTWRLFFFHPGFLCTPLILSVLGCAGALRDSYNTRVEDRESVWT